MAKIVELLKASEEYEIPKDAMTIPVIDRTQPGWEERRDAQFDVWYAEYKLMDRVKSLGEGWGSSEYRVKPKNGGRMARIISYHKKHEDGSWWKTPVLREEFDIDGNLVHTEVTDLRNAC